MRISTLLLREPFYEILSDTLGEVYREDDLKNWLGIENKPQVRYVNEYLNFIASKKTPHRAFNNLYNEYSFTDVNWRKYPQKLWAYLSIHKWMRTAFSQKKLQLDFSIDDHIIVLGGNHRLRFYDYRKNEMLVFLKANENPGLIENEIELRTNSDYDHMPKVFDFGKNWFIESSIKGIPVNRMPLKNRDFLKRKILALHSDLVISPSMKMIPAVEYTSELWNELEKYQMKEMGFSRSAFEGLCRLVIEYEGGVAISKTHGDFQEGNILVEKQLNPFVIDWECTEIRFFLYDDFVLWSNIRGNPYSEEMFDHYYQSMVIRINNNVKDLKILNIVNNKGVVRSLLILEEIRFQFYNQFSRPNVQLDDEFKTRISNLFKTIKGKD